MATREENLKKINEELEKLSDEELEQLSDEELKKRCTYAIDNSSGSLIDGQIISILKDLGLEKN